VHGEQTCLREESIWPALMVLATSAETASFLLPAQQRTQATTDLPVKPDEREFMRMPEIGKPAFEQRVQVRHDTRQAVASRAPCPGPDTNPNP
jgi:hypothetical protein